jgi:hypothetical protein
LLSGKAVCGVCGANWRIVQGERWGCAAHHDGRGCSNGRTITDAASSGECCGVCPSGCSIPSWSQAYVEEWQAARTERLAGSRKDRSRLERRKADADKRVARLVAAIADGLGEIERDRSRASAQRATSAIAPRRSCKEIAAEKVVALHPGLAGDYRRRIADLTAALTATTLNAGAKRRPSADRQDCCHTETQRHRDEHRSAGAARQPGRARGRNLARLYCYVGAPGAGRTCQYIAQDRLLRLTLLLTTCRNLWTTAMFSLAPRAREAFTERRCGGNYILDLASRLGQ